MFNSRFHHLFPNEMNLNRHLFGKIWMMEKHVIDLESVLHDHCLSHLRKILQTC